MSEGKVVVIGGGVGGLSAAHHLTNKGFEVEVYELHDIPGGKARSLGVPDSGTGGRHDLPAEHGFRFFPAFYFHIIRTMQQIPYWDEGENVEDQLVSVESIGFTNFTHRPMLLSSKLPHTIWGWWRVWRQARKQPRPKFKRGEIRFYLARLWQIVTSCNERREDQYEVTPWWHFIDADQKSLNYQRYIANMARTLVAANPEKVSTRTNGNVLLQTLMGMWGPKADRVLSGPTNEMWIHPWLKYLIKEKGVKYYINAQATEFEVGKGRVQAVKVERTPGPRAAAKLKKITLIKDVDRYGITEYEEVDADQITPTADYYISAVPVERMAVLVATDDDHGTETRWSKLAELDPSLKTIPQLAYSVQWMNGLQFYLRNSEGHEEPPNLPGHSIYADSPLALTSIFQPQYWGKGNIDLSAYGDGTVTNILSVDISNWFDAKGRIYDKPAVDLTRQKVKDEVWADVKNSLKHDPVCRLEDENLVCSYLDPDIQLDRMFVLRNSEPLLVNRVNTMRLRPDATTGIDNLFLASDYVLTYTDLATMEGANEAARRAVNGILDQAGSNKKRCEVRKLPQPELLKPFRDYDLERYKRGEDWSNKFPILMKLKFYLIVFLILIGLKRS